MSDTLNPVVETTPVPQAPLPPVPADAPVPHDPLARERYEQMYGRPAPSPSPTQSPEPTTPAPVAATQGSEEVIQILNSLKAELEELRSTRVSPPSPTQPSTPPAAEPRWVDLVREGKIDEADAFLRKQIIAEATPLILEQVRSEATRNSGLEKQITAWNETLRSGSPEVVDFEDVIATRVEKELIDMMNRGLVKDDASYIDAYKKVTSKHVDNAKQQIQRIRAGGKIEAQTAHSQVLVGGSPNPSDSARLNPTTPVKDQPKTYVDIIRERQVANLKRQGL